MPDGTQAHPLARRDLLARRRRSLGLTQEDLAHLLGIHRSTVARWERGETEPVNWMQPRLAKALRVSTDRLGSLLADAAGSGGETAVGSGGAPADGMPTAAGNTPAKRAGATASTVPRQLPAAVHGFTGRDGELAALNEILDTAGSGPGTVVISAIGGAAGVGKTALALHWAHRIASQFRDGQLHVNLRGFDPSGTPVPPEEAVRGFLHALGVGPDRVPPSPEEQAALYRSLLADKKMLIVLDNARDEEQVRPLLPASPACLVIVTSRSQLTGLVAAHGARLLSVDVMTREESVELLTARIGSARTTAEPAVVTEIASLCACLPLALAIAAARAAASPGLPLTALAAELRDATDRLDALDTGDPATSVRAVFSWSYSQLSDAAARMFRLLGIHPGPDISVPAAASLGAISADEARRLLRALTSVQLIAEHAPDRFAFHDLLRAFAVSQCHAVDSVAERNDARVRILAYYLHTANAADALLRPARETFTLAPAVYGVTPEDLSTAEGAMAWFEAEDRALLAAVTLASRSGLERYAWQLCYCVWQVLSKRGRIRECLTAGLTALDAATRCGDVAGQALSSRVVANGYVNLGDYDKALGYYNVGLTLYERLGDHLGEAKVYQALSVLAERQGRPEDALRHNERALELYRSIGNKEATAEALNSAGYIHALLGDYAQARTFCREALALFTDSGNRDYLAATWDSLGYAEQHLGNFTEAAACYDRALSIAREVGHYRGEAEVLVHIGDASYAKGQLPEAREAWQQALAIFEYMAHPGADEIRAKLADLGT